MQGKVDIKDPFISRGCRCAPNVQERCLNVFKHSCNKKDSYNWLKHIKNPEYNNFSDFVEVKFKNSRKDYYRTSEDTELKEGDIVAVEANPGHDIGIVTLIGYAVRIQMKNKQLDPENGEFKKVYRKAKTSDIEKWIAAVNEENKTMYKAREIASSLKLEMKISDVEYQGDKTKAIFYYTANERVDFRELIKVYAETFNVRIEMKQIGMRQEAGRLGGIGSCGRELCCATWINNFQSVSTAAARNQQLSLNPQKLAGQCSKLKCCINYENDVYLELLSEMPDTSIKLKTKSGTAVFQKSDVIKKLMWYSISLEEPEEKNNIIQVVSFNRAKEIIELNKKGILPENLTDDEVLKEPENKGFQSSDIVNQDSLTRFDKEKSKSKKKKRRKKKQKQNNVNKAQ